MPETQKASLGYKGEFWLHDGVALYRLRQIKQMPIPTRGLREKVQVTTLESLDWTHEYLDGFREDTDFDVVMLSRLLSDTYIKVEAALTAGDVRAFKVVIPENGVPVAQIEGTCRVINHVPGEMTIDGVIEATMTYRIVSIEAVEAYVA